MIESVLVVAVFAVVYIGMALGRWPGLAIDRTGVALVGAIVLLAAGAVDGDRILRAVDVPTLALLFALMVISAQFEASGFFAWCGSVLAAAGVPPRRLLLYVIGCAAALSAVLTNDIVVWAMTPVLVRGLAGRGLDPRVFVVGLAAAANAGSAATVIGNPQNLLIGQVGDLAFWPFLAACGALAVAATAVVYLVARRRVAGAAAASVATPPPLDRPALAKGVAAVLALLAVFTLGADVVTGALAIAGALLLSRRQATPRMLGLVDWHLLLLFGCLFVVTGALSDVLPALHAGPGGLPVPGGLPGLAAVSLVGGNTIGNVPLVTLLLSLGFDLGSDAFHALAVFSTLSGNLLVVGSMANVIAVERARQAGCTVGFVDFARIGIPVTLVSLGIAFAWFALLSVLAT